MMDITSVAVSCRVCGHPLEPGADDGLCPQCELRAASPEKEKTTILDLALAFVVWGVSGGLLLGMELVTRVVYWFVFKSQPKVEVTVGIVMLSLGLTFVMHLAGFVAAWLVVTRVGKRPFWSRLGWNWHPQFKLVHAIGLAILMMGVAIVLEKTLPHTQTDLEKILGLGMTVRIAVALLAVATAPLIEELVYRGVLYSAIEGLWGRAAAFLLSASIFAVVHVPQYWGSVAAITAILTLSLVLTGLRSWTGQLLPCVVVHMIYNGIQAVGLLVAPQKLPDQNQSQAAIVHLLHFVGLS
ncbi:MAG: CPBP family glutamic-type intramembrane protease [Blastocatellia bacterium]|nr:CPBP family glutamic-type intramembrane protease [Blastocatellia bacterium]